MKEASKGVVICGFHLLLNQAQPWFNMLWDYSKGRFNELWYVFWFWSLSFATLDPDFILNWNRLKQDFAVFWLVLMDFFHRHNYYQKAERVKEKLLFWQRPPFCPLCRVKIGINLPHFFSKFWPPSTSLHSYLVKLLLDVVQPKFNA